MEFGASQYTGLGPRVPLREMIPVPRYASRCGGETRSCSRSSGTGALWPQFFDPLFYLLALGFGLGTYIATDQRDPYKEFIGPGLIASAAMWAASFETT